jgi:hypothetical protein
MVVSSALRHYLLEVCLQRIERAERQIAAYQQRYGSNYETFSQKVASDEAFLEATSRTYPMWEADAIEWEYRVDEAKAWRERSGMILRVSFSMTP